MIRDDADAFDGHSVTSTDTTVVTPGASDPGETPERRAGPVTRVRRRLGAVIAHLSRRS